ncbi:hypothetical protein PMIN07_003369 [Paraphaeosphaeria minitans]
MAQHEDSSVTALQELQQPSPSQDEQNQEQALLHRNDDRKRALVLIGSALSQLPIWGFAMSYGVLQEYYFDHWTLDGSRELTGIIGTTSNGVMYMSMPFLFALFTRRWVRFRQTAAAFGAILACTSFMLFALSTRVWHLIATQGVLAAPGCTLVFSPLTLSLGEWFKTPNRLCNRAVALGISLSNKNIVGSACPFFFRGLLDSYGFRVTMLAWGALILTMSGTRGRKIPWLFLRHKTFWIYTTATLLQSAGYGIPQTYLTEYARNVSNLSPTFSTLFITLINIPGICSSTFFGFLSDNKHFRLSAQTVTAISAITSALGALLFWGLAGRGGTALLVLFAMTFGVFASGYSATWGSTMNDMEREAAERNEVIDSGVLYGLLNDARGVGYVTGGLVTVPLAKAGSTTSLGRFGYGTTYGPLIVFTALSLACGRCGIVFRPKWKRLLPTW